MSNTTTERDVIALINGYRARMRANGQPVKVVLALVSIGGAGADQPKGYCTAWGVLRAYVEARQQQQTKPESWEIIEIQPDQEIEQ